MHGEIFYQYKIWDGDTTRQPGLEWGIKNDITPVKLFCLGLLYLGRFHPIIRPSRGSKVKVLKKKGCLQAIKIA